MKENELQRLVLGAMRACGWNVAHFGNSVKFVRKGAGYITIPDKDATGFPDIVAVRYGHLMFVELKSSTGRIRDEQAVWLHDLREVEKRTAARLVAVSVYVWYPVDWEDGTILRVIE